MGFPFFRRGFDGCGGCGGFAGCGIGGWGGCGGCGFDGFDGGCGCGCGFDRVKTKFFNIRGCVTERCGRDGWGGWW